MKLSQFAKKMKGHSNAPIHIYQNGKQIKEPQWPSEFLQKIEREIIEDFTIQNFAVVNNTMQIYVK